jgi:putative addiction module component (TIGR02574 family)
MSVISEAETIEQALKLPDESRARLAEKLIASLPSPFVDEDEDWVEEALRRDREMDENPGSVMTEEEFFASLREYIK